MTHGGGPGTGHAGSRSDGAGASPGFCAAPPRFHSLAARAVEAMLGTDIGAGLRAEEAARRLADEVRPLMAKARAAADRLEHLVDDELWELPKYREMLFVR